jgi:hypothetical protein
MSAQFKVGDRVRLKASEQEHADEFGLHGDLVIEEIAHDVAGFAGHAFVAMLSRLELAPPALIRADRRYRTRSGRAVKRIICTDAEGDFPVVAVVERYAGGATINTYTADGKYIRDCGNQPEDLIEIPAEPIVGFVNLYRTQGGKIAVSTALSPDGPDPLPAPTNAVWLASAKVEVLP